MGTHPIFESDFDCLTDSYNRSQWQKEPRNTNHPSVVPPLSREPLSVSGIVPVPTKRSLVAPGSHTPRTTPSLLWVSDVSERMLKTKYFTAISRSHSLKIEMIIAPLLSD